MLNVKSDICSQFKASYDDIENIKDIEDDIKQRVDKLQLKKINKDEFETIIEYNLPNLSITSPSKFLLSFNKK
jgi:hypothetical protein